MMLTIDNDTVRRYIPNVLCEVDSEIPLVNKLYPFLEAAKRRLAESLVGYLTDLPEDVEEMMMRYVVTTAFADAAPSLDIVLTPSGFGVISTNSMAPASKERVERLILSLRSSADLILVSLVHALHQHAPWRESPIGAAYCSTFYSDFDDVSRRGGEGNLFDRWRRLSGFALEFEEALADRCLGRNLLSQLRDGFNSREIPAGHPVVALIRQAQIRYIDKCEAGMIGTPHNFIWTLCRPIVARVKLDDDLRAIWEAEKGELFAYKGFKNDIKGGFFF